MRFNHLSFSRLNFNQNIHNFSFKQIKTAIKDDESILLAKKSKGIDVGRAIYDLITNGIKGVIKKDSLMAAIEEIALLHCDMVTIILDVLHIKDIETQSGPTEDRSSFGLILKGSHHLFSEKLLKERLEIDTLQEFAIVNKTFYTKFIKVSFNDFSLLLSY